MIAFRCVFRLFGLLKYLFGEHIIAFLVIECSYLHSLASFTSGRENSAIFGSMLRWRSRGQVVVILQWLVRRMLVVVAVTMHVGGPGMGEVPLSGRPTHLMQSSCYHHLDSCEFV